MQENWIGKSQGLQFRFALAEPIGGIDGIEVFTTRPDTIFGASFVAVVARSSARAGAGRGATPASPPSSTECQQGGTTAAELETAEKLGFDTGLEVVHPLDPRLDAAGLHRQFRADGLRHRRDLRRARRTTSATSISRTKYRPADPPRGRRRAERGRRADRRRGRDRRRRRWSIRDFLDGMDVEDGQGRGHRPRRGRGLGRGHDRLAPARLGRVAPALLGHADPDHPLRRLRRGAGAEGPAAGRAARGRRLRHARQPARAPPDLEACRLPVLRRRRRGARPTRSTRSSIPAWYFIRFASQPATGRSTAPRPSAGCRSTNISAASSMRSCTCSTRASGRARSSGSACSTSTEPFEGLFTQGMVTHETYQAPRRPLAQPRRGRARDGDAIDRRAASR